MARMKPAFLFSIADRFSLDGLGSRLRWPEWCGLAFIAAVDAVWASRSGFRVIVGMQDFALPVGIAAVAVALHSVRQNKAALITEYLALTLFMALAFTVLAYLCLAASGPMADARL